jgi:GTPase
MFVDKVQVEVKAGDGGDGIVSFRHEKFIDKGGPDGGDGGRGGNVIFEASRNQNTLAAFRYQKRIEASPGKPGGKRKMHGRSGQDLVIQLPVGTVVTEASGEVIADLTEDAMQTVIARGGQGGFGNAHFVSSTRQAPRIGEKGEKGEQRSLILELKMIADVGLVGLPNAGKSTLLAAISNARPEIANYPFTTIRPNLGMVDVDEQTSLLFADIPGLIEGAAEGKGLGDDFLRHVERTKVLIHLLDIYQNDIASAYQTIQKELKAYRVDLSKRPQLVVLNKIDGLDEDIVADKTAELKTVLPKRTRVFAVSAQSRAGVRELLFAVKNLVIKQRKQEKAKGKDSEPSVPVIRLQNDEAWSVAKHDSVFVVTGRKIERFAARTDFTSFHAVQRLRDIMKKMGIMHELTRQGIEPGQKIKIGSNSLEY